MNWAHEKDQEKVREGSLRMTQERGEKLLPNAPPYQLPKRLWVHLLKKGGISQEKRWKDLGKKELDRLADFLTRDVYPVNGKSTFKEEFVTCGGVSLDSVDMKTMESKVYPGLYFAGEILDIDAITGGYNFQAAWTTAYVAGLLKGSSSGP